MSNIIKFYVYSWIVRSKYYLLSQSYRSLDFKEIEVKSCSCCTLPQVLVRNGLFPTAPSLPRLAVSTHLLELYQALFEQSCDAVNSMAAAVRSYYRGRGFQILDIHVSVDFF